MKRRIVRWAILVLFFGLCLAGAFWLTWNGFFLPNGSAASKYEVHGVDVSSYQGEIDWELLASQNIQFAFLKATEGSGHVDSYFQQNLEGALQTGLRVGAYHFFSYDSPGITQAENFIATVPIIEGMLPPVVDVEFYGDKEQNPPERAEVEAELTAMLTALEEHYGTPPILYATEKSYQLYLESAFPKNDIWIRNVIGRPSLSDDRDWLFWQYTNRGRLEGYAGEEDFIDINVFAGSAEEFAVYPSK
ncbi:MAG: GH25 family lysozyme [Oscillospiraceae bacterium]